MRYTEADRALFLNSADHVAPILLGKVLCRKAGDHIIRLRIIETEAYLDPARDNACYGKHRTKATAPLFALGGTCCIYAGMLLIACGDAGCADNVLIRGCADSEHYFSGPLRVSRALELDRSLHGADLLNSDELWLEDSAPFGHICRTTRVGLSDAVSDEARGMALRSILI